MFHTHTESQTHTHTYCYTPIKTYKYRGRLTLFSFVWHLIHFDLFVLLKNSLSAIEFARVETSDSEHTDSHTRLHCAFIACVHRRRRTETETYFWALHLSASQPASQRSRRALASSIIRMRPRVCCCRCRLSAVVALVAAIVVVVVFVCHRIGKGNTRPKPIAELLLNSPHFLSLSSQQFY